MSVLIEGIFSGIKFLIRNEGLMISLD